ncbi:uncharacterized protein LOC131072578 isoform X2 [Cryptomeria japonica]|uniref:uncharacterized protein LOC131072578 isoform X2 n=1 Tax=Cryptomeria japonica TaxID=3369 RepID=UPI0025ABCB59|nr:uncharacterized protein LOC131072578 isoform X2 [Cryptomeria japonica]
MVFLLYLPISTLVRFCPKLAAYHMERFCESYEKKSHAKLRLHKVAGHSTEILELHAERPSFHILFIPGNPGIVTFYRDYLEVLYELFDKKASVTAIGHVAHTSKDWEDGKLFSLQEQISHKVGHSIGAYISLDIFKAFPQKVSYMIGMYPFLTLNRDSNFQAFLTKAAKLPILCAGLSSLAGLVGLFPSRFNRGLIKRLVGRTWSSDAVHVASTYLLRYSMVRNYTYMGMTEFEKLQEIPDWTFIRGKENQIAFLFGSDDHWGPLSLFEEVSQKAPGISLAIEKEGHTHAFCCTQAGSTWVAEHTVDLIKQHLKGEH